jgi:transcriptional regulator with XRE-family HTH domain
MKESEGVAGGRYLSPNGKHIRELRMARGWTQKELADQADCDKGTIERAEKGKPMLPGTLKYIADALRVPLDTLIAVDCRPETHPESSQGRGAGADSSALGAGPSALAQEIGAVDLAAPPGAEERRANCPGMYTAPHTASEKDPTHPEMDLGDTIPDAKQTGRDDRPPPDNSAVPDRPKGQGEEIPVNVPSQGARVKLTILVHYDCFSAKEEADLLAIIKAAARLTGEIRVIFRRRGSLILTLGLSGEDAERLCRAVDEGALDDHRVVACTRLPDFLKSNASLRLCQNRFFGLLFGIFRRFWQSLFRR